ncbi:glycosyltransferase family 39 protein [bacterium]|nr:glycosyltransferase family 39 protein [bacterium]
MKKKRELLLLFLLWALSLFLRIYRQNDLLGFYYDQGRDALKTLDILSFRDWPAVGPTTGLSGIFLGPFWFYFITPFYWLGRGNPAFAASCVGIIDSLSIFLFYWLGKRFFSKKVGFLAAFLWAFSYWLIRSARWFSNPSPLPFFTLLLLWGLGEWLINRKDKFLGLVSLCLAISLQLEVASAVFYLPAVFLLMGIFKVSLKDTVKKKSFWQAAGIFLLFLLPQMAFEVKNHFLIIRNFFGFLGGKVNTEEGKSWAFPNGRIILERLRWYHRALFAHIDPNWKTPWWLFSGWLAFLSWWGFKRKNQFLKILLVFLLVPLFFLFFFVGNYGNLYDYYLTGFFPVFIFLFAYFLSLLPAFVWVVFLLWFVFENGILLRNFLTAGVDGPDHITLGNQKQVISWICQDRKDKKFSVDTYVPPVIPYAWDYLWQWYGCRKLHCCPSSTPEKLFYSVWEKDNLHPDRLESWLEREGRVGKIEKQMRFGGIGVERRIRIEE